MPADSFTPAEIAAYYEARVPSLKPASAGSHERRGPCPIHQGDRDSFAVDSATGQWFCHSECGCGGSLIKLEMELTSKDSARARQQVLRIIGRTWHTVASDEYTDEAGEPLYRVIRRERGTGAEREKTFHIERYKQGRWIKDLGKTRRVPYRLHEIVKFRRVFIVEGEKCAKAVRKQFRLVATTSPMGAGKWRPEFAEHFRDKCVIILPDNDAPGREHALTMAASLLPVASSVRVVELPGLPEKGDVADWAETGGTREQLEALANACPALDDAKFAELRSRWGLDTELVTRRFPFQVADDGVYWLGHNDEPTRIAARVEVVAETRDAAGDNWGRLLRWNDNEGRSHQWAMPMEMLAADAAAVRARLLGGGLPFISTNARHREKFVEYLQTVPTNQRICCVPRIGWHDDCYALPDTAIARAGGETVLYQTPHEAAHYWKVKGSAEDWREHVGQLCSGNSRLILGVSCGFAGPLLALLGAESGGVHFHGLTSVGKTTMLVVAGSVCGGGGPAGFVQTWRTTINGLEAIAESHNNATLFLDELSQVDARVAAETAYLLGNGQGKQRMTRSIAAGKKLTWTLLYVSAGETTLAEHAASAGKRIRGGAEVRLLNIEADAGAGWGLFENLHGAKSADAFARELKESALRYYGAPFRAFLKKLVRNKEAVANYICKTRRAFAKQCVPAEAPGEVRRAADRFALIGAAGEIATHWGLTGWQRDEAMLAAKRAFGEWQVNRGSRGASDAEAGVRVVRAFLQTQSSRFETIQRVHCSEKREVIHDRAGYVRLDERTREPQSYYIFPEVFRREVCNEFSSRAVLNELKARGYLECEPPNLTCKPNLPGMGRTRVYCIRASIQTGDE